MTDRRRASDGSRKKAPAKRSSGAKKKGTKSKELSRDQVQALAEQVRDFKLDLVAMLPDAAPPTRAPTDKPSDSELLFEAILRKNNWRLTAKYGLAPPPPLPPEFLAGDDGEPPPRLLRDLQREACRVVAPDVPNPLSREMNDLRREVRDGYEELSPQAMLLEPLRETFQRIGELQISRVGEYRLLLVVRWLVEQIDSDVYREEFARSRSKLINRDVGKNRTKPDRLERLGTRLREVLDDMGIPTGSWPAKQPDSSTPRRPTGTSLDSRDLPSDILWWPDSLKRVARAILAVPAKDLDTELQREATEYALFGKIPAERLTPEKLKQIRTPEGQEKYRIFSDTEVFTVEAGLWHEPRSRYGDIRHHPGRADGRDPVAAAGFQAMDGVLKKERLTAKVRRPIVIEILNVVYPRGFLSTRSPGTPRAPSGSWSAETLRRL